MNRSSNPVIPTVELESHTTMPRGGVARRCQGLKKDGSQCIRPAGKDSDFCQKHGGKGSPARVARGERKPAGAPIIHGMQSKYLKRTLLEKREELRAANITLDSSNEALLGLHANFEWLLERSETFSSKLDDLEKLTELLDSAAQAWRKEAESNPTEEGKPDYQMMNNALEVARAIPKADTLLARFYQWLEYLRKAAEAVAKVIESRANTRARLAETKALEAVEKQVGVFRAIVHEILGDDAKIQLFDDRVRREVIAQMQARVGMRVVDERDN